MADFGRFLSEIHLEASGNKFQNEPEFRQEFLAQLGAVFSASGWKEIRIRLEESLAEGRSDARISYMVFEFKAPGILATNRERDLALKETIRNLRKTSEKLGVDKSKLRGLLTDGRDAQIFSWHEPSSEYVAVDLGEKPLPDKFVFRPLVEVAPWLEGSIHVLRTRELSPENLLEDFGPGSDLGSHLFAELWRTFQETKTQRRAKSFFEQWKLLFSASTRRVVSGANLKDRIRSYGIEAAEVRTEEDVREFLFVLHTHYAIVLKFIAILVADTIQLLGSTSLLQRIKSDAAQEWPRAEEALPRLAANLIERDVFSWFQLDSRPELTSLFQLSAERVAHYDAESVRRDVLKRVYQEVIPPKLRKALGEFYTPDWAAELTLNEVGYLGKGTLLDPACGSGTFLALAIRRKIEGNSGMNPALALSDVLDSIVGFDLNPVAVSTARINYLLAIVDLLKQARPDHGVKIPVFLCDSVVVPSESVLDPKAPTAVVTTCLGDLVVPFDETLPQNTARMLQLLESHAARSEESFLNSVRTELGVAYEDSYRHILRGLHRFIADLQAHDADGIWARFVENFFAPLFAVRFDYVVGNPPWVAPVHVSKEYRDKITSLTKSSGYVEVYDPKLTKSEARYRAAESAYVACLPFVHVAFDRYLKETDTSRIGFILTKSLVTALNAGGWRREVIDRLERVTDLSPITDIHEGADCWAFIPVFKRPAVVQDLPYAFCQRASPRKRRGQGEPVPDLEVNRWNLDRRSLGLDPRDTRSPWLIGPQEVIDLFRKMCLDHPRLGDVYKLNMGVKSDDNDTFFVEQIDSIKDGIAKVVTSGKESIQVEEELLFPLVVGEDVSEWTCRYKWIILPYDSTTWKPIPEPTLKSDFPEAHRHFLNHKVSLESRAQYKQLKSGAPLWTVFQLSSSKTKSEKVVFPLIELLMKAALAPRLDTAPPISGPRAVIIDHSAYFLNVESRQARHYVSGLLNSSLYRALAYSLAMPKSGFPYKQYVQWNIAVLPVVPMEVEPAQTRALATEVETALKSGETGTPQFAARLDHLVGELFGLTESETTKLNRFLEFSLGKITKWDS